MRTGQVVAREVDEGVVLGVDELWLCSHVAGVVHGLSCVDDIHLWGHKALGRHQEVLLPTVPPGDGQPDTSSLLLLRKATGPKVLFCLHPMDKH